MEAALRALLTGYAPLTALVSAGGIDRIYWNDIPQDAADPCVVMYLIDAPPIYTFSGAADLTGSVVQIDVRALTVSSSWAVRDAIVDKLSGYRAGDFGAIFLRRKRSLPSEKPGDTLYRRASLDFDVWHTPPA